MGGTVVTACSVLMKSNALPAGIKSLSDDSTGDVLAADEGVQSWIQRRIISCQTATLLVASGAIPPSHQSLGCGRTTAYVAMCIVPGLRSTSSAAGRGSCVSQLESSSPPYY